MKAMLLTSLSLLLAVGCSSTPDPRAEGHWIPDCKVVGCVESNPGARAPLGAELSFPVCEDGGRSTYRFEREARGWVLHSRRAEQDAACAAKAGE